MLNYRQKRDERAAAQNRTPTSNAEFYYSHSAKENMDILATEYLPGTGIIEAVITTKGLLDHSLEKKGFQIGTNICQIEGKIGCNRNWLRAGRNAKSFR